MTDRDAFPSRGQTGFSTTIGEGLLALRTGPVWARHRRIVSKFMSDKYLLLFSCQVQSQTEILLAKWTDAAGKRQAVNVQYDLSTLTEDIIGCIAFGKEFGSQSIPQEENQDAEDRDLMLKEIVLRTSNPFAPYFASAEHKKRLVQISKNRSAKSASLIALALQNAKDNGLLETSDDEGGDGGDDGTEKGGAREGGFDGTTSGGSGGGGKGRRARKDAVKEGDNMVSVMKRTQMDGSKDQMSDSEIAGERKQFPLLHSSSSLLLFRFLLFLLLLHLLLFLLLLLLLLFVLLIVQH
jgi:cytochrome P450